MCAIAAAPCPHFTPSSSISNATMDLLLLLDLYIIMRHCICGYGAIWRRRHPCLWLLISWMRSRAQSSDVRWACVYAVISRELRTGHAFEERGGRGEADGKNWMGYSRRSHYENSQMIKHSDRNRVWKYITFLSTTIITGEPECLKSGIHCAFRRVTVHRNTDTRASAYAHVSICGMCICRVYPLEDV